MSVGVLCSDQAVTRFAVGKFRERLGSRDFLANAALLALLDPRPRISSDIGCGYAALCASEAVVEMISTILRRYSSRV